MRLPTFLLALSGPMSLLTARAAEAPLSVVVDFGLSDQPMLDEMATKALAVLKRAPKGFVPMIEGASIDKQALAMDTERWMLDTLEFDRAVRVAQDFAAEQGDTPVIVTADHECSGAALIGGAIVTDKQLIELAAKKGVANLRKSVVAPADTSGSKMPPKPKR